MSVYTESFEGHEDQNTEASDGDIQKLMLEKAQELFKICDTEGKGFMTKRDIQRLKDELPLNPDQLEAVFESLDEDQNGFLTIEEFTDGFGNCFGFKTNTADAEEGSSAEPDTLEQDYDPVEEEHNFKLMMENMGAKSLFDDESTIQALWCRLRKEDPEMSSNFEDFLYKISNEIRKSKTDFDTLESALKSKSSAHDEEVQKLYEEMEYQIKQEKERVVAEERLKERQLREAMEADLYEKDKQLQELMAKHQEMEEKMKQLNMTETETKLENEKLAREKEMLEESLYQSQTTLEESKSYINQIRMQQKDDKRERARAALKLSEGIAIERESLVKQLDLLRNMNKKLRDDKDEADIRRLKEAESRQESPRRGELERQGSSLGKYFPTSRIPKLSSASKSISEDVESPSVARGQSFEVDDGIECDDNVYMDSPSPKFIYHHLDSFHNDSKLVSSSPLVHSDSSHSNSKQDSRHSNVHLDGSSPILHDKHGRKEESSGSENEYDIPDSGSHSPSHIHNSPRHQPIGSDELTDSGIQANTESTESYPQRVFKVVFIGDSGVGKSSFIQRFCHNTFRPSYSATIGVDFQIKNLIIENHSIVLQLWDTAGQERFRSITKQYFRKADGVVVMYDVTSETSFTNIRNWMTSVQEGASEELVSVLLGNKSDLPEEDGSKLVKMKDGIRLADEYGSLFYETSALNGENVCDAMEALARVLKEKEDEEIQQSFKLGAEQPSKKFCCKS